jgi:hypothetical protein
VAVLRVDDLVEPGQRLVQISDVVQDLFVDCVCVLELSEVDALGGADDLDLGGV